PRECKGRGRICWNAGGRQMVRSMGESGERQAHIVAASLVKHPRGKRARKTHRDPFVNPERQRSSQARDHKTVATRSGETAEVGFVNFLVWGWRVGVADVRTQSQVSRINGLVTLRAHEKK